MQPLAAFSGKIGMCGIIGYIGNNTDTTIGLEALKRLEYRGYDSAGMALLRPRLRKGKPVPGQYEVFSMKAVGRISKLEEKLGKNKPKGTPFIFHTRWATHGAPTELNAHPHATPHDPAGWRHAAMRVPRSLTAGKSSATNTKGTAKSSDHSGGTPLPTTTPITVATCHTIHREIAAPR